MEEKVYFKSTSGTRICGLLSNIAPSINTPVVILVHGFASNKESKKFLGLMKLLHDAGIETFRIDLYGHGESEGEFSKLTISETVDDVLQAISFLKQRGYKDIGLFGSSLGGLACLMAASKYKDISFLTLKSPVSDYRETLRLKYTDLDFKQWKEKGVLTIEDEGLNYDLEYTFYEDLQNNNAYKAASLIQIPVLIVHGERDSIVPITQSKKLYSFLTNGTLHEIRGADHWYKGEGKLEELHEVVFNFMISRFS